jgi:Fic family protein
MHLPYIQLDDRLDAVLAAEQRAPRADQRAFRKRFTMCWLYHELSLEGVAVNENDLQRALSGREGRDYCDNQRLLQIRAFHDAVERLRVAAASREELSVALLNELHDILAADADKPKWRADEGATEAYKHDVVDPEIVQEELAAVMTDAKNAGFKRHPVALAVHVHYRLIRVWPYNLFSAAIARMASNLVLMSNGYPPALIHASDRQRYYHAMHYDVTRLQDLVYDSLCDQISLRERLFAASCESRMAISA